MFEGKIWKIILAIGGLVLGAAQMCDSGKALIDAIHEPEDSEETPEQNEEGK